MMSQTVKSGETNYMTGQKNSVMRKRKMPVDTVLFIVSGLFLTVSHLIIFWFGVQVNGIAMAFTDYETGSFTLLGNFKTFLASAQNAQSPIGEGIRNTFIFFSIYLVTGWMSIFVAYMILKKMAGSTVVRIILYLPGAISTFMMAMLYQELLISDGPIMTFLNGKLNLGIPTPLIMEAALAEIMIFDIWISLGGGLIIWFGAMNRIPVEILEYGQLDGVGPFKEFFSIIMPLIWPTFVTMTTLSIIGIFGATGSILLFTGGKYGTNTISYWLFDVVYSGYVDSYNISAAAGLFFTFLTIPLVVGGRLLMNRFGQEVEY